MTALISLREMVEPPISEIQHLMVELPPSDKKKTIIFDLDETLIHTVDDPYD